MKKLILLFFGICFSVIMLAQNETSHAIFKGMFIDGDINEFEQKLLEQGYELVEKDESSVAVMGSFAGKEDCVIYVVGTPVSKTVCKIAVYLEESSSWQTLKAEYLNLKKLYTEKYGRPKSNERFYKPYYEGDGYEISALRREKCTYSSKFESENTIIDLLISYNGESDKGFVFVIYKDKINAAIQEKEMNQNISNDI